MELDVVGKPTDDVQTEPAEPFCPVHIRASCPHWEQRTPVQTLTEIGHRQSHTVALVFEPNLEIASGGMGVTCSIGGKFTENSFDIQSDEAHGS